MNKYLHYKSKYNQEKNLFNSEITIENNLFNSEITIEKKLFNSEITIEKLFDLFTKSCIYDKIIYGGTFNSPDILLTKRSRSKVEINGINTGDLLNSVTPGTGRKKLETQIHADDNNIIKVCKLLEDKDTDYIFFEGTFGKTIEIWLADNLQCPCCGATTLKRYQSDFMPVIDLVCVNKNHVDGVKFFQVKSSTGNLFKNKPYFSLDDKTIHVGSLRYGEPIHEISGISIYDKKLAIGYICVFVTINENKGIIIINGKSSFIVLPNLEYNGVEKYYSYLEKEIHPVITWNSTRVNVKSLDIVGNIPTDYDTVNTYIVITNPLA